MATISERRADWREFNLFARSYLDFQHLRIAIEHRLRLFKENKWIEAGLMNETVTERKDWKGKTRRKIKRAFIEYEDETDNRVVREKAKMIEDDLRENSEAYRDMYLRSKLLADDEQKMLRECKELFKTSKLWEWCENVKGLGEVAALTFLGYIRPQLKTSTGLRVTRVEDVWQYFGLTPDSKIVSGKKSKFNLELKGRMYVIARNIVMQGDPYYDRLYRMKKEYYMQCDEVMEKKGKIPGWAGWVDAMAKKAMIKIVVSHAVEIIVKSQGLEFTSKHLNNRYLPPKPEEREEVDKYLRLFAADMPLKIETRNRRWRNRENKDNNNNDNGNGSS